MTIPKEKVGFCVGCKVKFLRLRKDRVWCSAQCRSKHHNGRRKKEKEKEKVSA